MRKRHKLFEQNHTGVSRAWRVASPQWREHLKLFSVYVLLSASMLALAGYVTLVLRFSQSLSHDFVFLPMVLLIMQPLLLAWYLTRSVRLGGSMASVVLVQLIICFVVIFLSMSMYPFFRASEESLLANLIVQDWCESVCPASVWAEHVEFLGQQLKFEQCPLQREPHPAI